MSDNNDLNFEETPLVDDTNEKITNNNANIMENSQADTELEQTKLRVEELENQLAAVIAKEKDLILRQHAELNNVRRRAEQDVEKAHKFGLEKFSKEILTVIDNLELAASAISISETDSEIVRNLIQGVELTLKSLLDTVNKFGIEAYGAIGEAFNPELHQAISVQPNPDFAPNTIINVLQKGYRLHGRVIRPAMVMVSQ